MKTAQSHATKIVKSKVVTNHFKTHESLLADMNAHRLSVTATQEDARAFLARAGLITNTGRPKQLIRG